MRCRQSCTHHTFLTLLKLVIRASVHNKSDTFNQMATNSVELSVVCRRMIPHWDFILFYIVSRCQYCNLIWKENRAFDGKKDERNGYMERWLANIRCYLITQCTHCLNDRHFMAKKGCGRKFPCNLCCSIVASTKSCPENCAFYSEFNVFDSKWS